MKKHLKYLKSEKGITLIELLAVLVIMAIIAAIAVPFISNQIQDSRNQAHVNEALNIISSAKLKYAQDETAGETVSYTTDQLAGYIDVDVTGVTVSFDGTDWSISGHDANKVLEKEDEAVTESELRSYLKNKDDE